MKPASGLLVAALVMSCAASRSSPLSESAAMGDLSASVTLTVDRTALPPGEVLVATVTVVNRTADTMELHFLTTQRYDFAFTDARGREVFRWSSDMMFGQAIGSARLAPGERLSGTERLRAPAEPGTYRLSGTIVSVGDTLTASTPITVAAR